MTRQDARDFLRIAAELNIQPQANVFSLENANQALIAVRDETENGSAVIVP
jgi:propanol-preferring alcohol dehydrogenase